MLRITGVAFAMLIFVRLVFDGLNFVPAAVCVYHNKTVETCDNTNLLSQNVSNHLNIIGALGRTLLQHYCNSPSSRLDKSYNWPRHARWFGNWTYIRGYISNAFCLGYKLCRSRHSTTLFYSKIWQQQMV